MAAEQCDYCLDAVLMFARFILLRQQQLQPSGRVRGQILPSASQPIKVTTTIRGTQQLHTLYSELGPTSAITLTLKYLSMINLVI